MTVVLVLGGVRSGKSRYAERLLADQPAVAYVAPGPLPDPAADPDWAHRIAAHRQRRPAHWRTVETADVPRAIREAGRRGEAVLVDCLGTWLTRVLDDAGAWDDRDAATGAADAATGHLVAALSGMAAARTLGGAVALRVVLVTNEVGLGVVPEHPSGRLFRDLLGRLNAAAADACDLVSLVIAGRVLDLSAAPRIEAAQFVEFPVVDR